MKTKLFAGLLVAALLIATVGAASAAPADARRISAITGDVTEIAGSTLTVQTPLQGVMKVQTDANTRFRQPGNPHASLSDVKVGDRIVARGERTADGLHANAVLIMPSNLQDVVIGKVQSITGSTIVVIKRDGTTANVATSDITVFRSPGKPTASLSDVKAGDVIEAAGVLSGTTLDAAIVRFNTRKRSTGPIALGTIQSIDGNTLTLQTRSLDSLTVNFTSSTFIVLRSQDGPTVGSISDLTQGAGIMVIGPRSSDGTSINAVAILIGERRGQPSKGASPSPQQG